MSYNQFLEDKDLIKKINYLINKVKNTNDQVETYFLDPYEQIAYQSILKQHHLSIHFYDKHLDCERKMGVIYMDHYQEPSCTIYQVIFNKKYYAITHRDVLGALMNLGIKREMVGDILVNKDEIAFLCASHMGEYIKDNLTQIKNAPIQLVEVNSFHKEDDGVEKKFIVSSLRLDTLVAHFMNINREDAKIKIKAKDIKVNHVVNANYKYICSSDHTLISMKGFGRVLILTIDGMTRKDNIVLLTKIYTRKNKDKK